MASIRTFVSHVPQHLLLRFLDQHSVKLESVDGKAGQIATAIEGELAERGPGARGGLVRDIETINRMTSENGMVALGDVTLDEELEGLESDHARALYLFLADLQRFRKAEDILYADDRRYGRQWNAFQGPKNRDLRRDPEAMEAFKQALRVAFNSAHVHIEFFERSPPGSVDEFDEDHEDDASLTQINIYRQDRPTAERAFQGEDLVMVTRFPVIEAAVMYEPGTGMIECVSGHRATREDVVRSFGQTLLGCEEDFELRPAPLYALSALKERQEFSFEPADGIVNVRVALLRIHPVDTNAERITLEIVGDGAGDIWHLADLRLGEGSLKSDYRIAQAKLVVRHKSAASGRDRNLPIMITPPHRSNIKEHSEIERVIADKYLPRWGLVSSQ